MGRHKKGKNVLVIGDLHSPFTLEDYLEHCAEVRDQYKCDKVIFIGDVIDCHFSSYHEHDPDGYGAGEELDRAIHHLQSWYKVFPKAEVCIGNHDAIVQRKAFSSGLSKKWVRGYSEVLGTKGWKFDMDFEHDGVLYIHGTGTSGVNAAATRALYLRKSVVQGHIHTEAYVRWLVSKHDRIFGMQVGCGVDDDEYAFAYAKNFNKKSVISCGVVLDYGKQAFPVLMKL